MKHCMLLALLLALGCMYVCAAPVAHEDIQPGSCEDASAKGAAELALTKINQDRLEGYIFALHRLSNVHMAKHGESGMVFYLTLDVVETNCSVLSKKDWKACEARPTHDTPVYGQCKAAIYISKVHRVTRLYKYDCVVRPVPGARVHSICPDCLSSIGMQNAEIQKAVTLSLEKFNSDSGLSKRFALLKVLRARAGMAMSMYYNVEYTIQETTCTKSAAAADKCPLMECEFAHKGFCKATLFYSPDNDADTSVECEVYEPEAAEAEKKHHLLGGETDHGHKDTHAHSHDHDGVHAADGAHTHDHDHDHTKSHTDHNPTQKHAGDSDHHHTHDHEVGSGHRHAHDHSHDHGHGHDHVHTHHAKAHNHSGDSPGQHHNYEHAGGVHTHEHDHELALDHDHKHAHLHDHEHHHHHHEHVHETTAHDHPVGTVRYLPAMNQPMTLPSFPEVPAGGPEVGVTLPLKPDPQVPGQMEPIIQPFPGAISPSCAPAATGDSLMEKVFSEDPMFKPAA
uniref:Cystatin fetuin-B-type domain-containing protein n=1 Tax=Gasterosteus aculeatus aculeatus TaxID=481459 RepID=A0AAQ4NSP6_GASAC|nr:histidine-rich glycoprotein-like isoform X1 [Gasterosteus aculeatus aculeatus]